MRTLFNNFTTEEQTQNGMTFTMLSRFETKENSSIFGNLQCFGDRKSVPEYPV